MTSLNPLSVETFTAPEARSQHDVACFSVLGEADPGLMPRVMQLFSKRGLVPARWHASRQGDTGEELVIDVQVTDMGPELAQRIGRSLRQLWGVEMVLVSAKTIY